MLKKICSLVDFKLLEEGPGGFSGYPSTFGNVDCAGEIVVKGAFLKCLTRFTNEGFVAVAHDWQGLPVATITEAHEDEKGLFVVAAFHSTPAAQAARVVMKERLERGKSVGLSIGYVVIISEQTAKGLLLKEIELYEFSIVTVPCNPEAGATSVKAGAEEKPLATTSAKATPAATEAPTAATEAPPAAAPERKAPETTAAPATKAPAAVETKDAPAAAAPETKGQYLGAYVEADMTYSAIYEAWRDLIWGPIWEALYDWDEDQDTLEERTALIGGALAEFSGLCLRVFAALMTPAAVDAQNAETSEEAGEYEADGDAELEMMSLWPKPGTKIALALPAGAKFGEQLDATLAAARSCAARAGEIAGMRAKSGRSLSTKRLEQLGAVKAALETAAGAMLPAAKDEAPAAAEGAELDVTALRMKARERTARLLGAGLE